VVTPPYKVFVGEVYNRSAAEGDPTEVTFSFFGVLIWDGSTPYQADNLTAANPRSLSVVNRSPEDHDPAELWIDRDNRIFLFLKTNSLDFEDCPAGGAAQ
jgi:hypothetical protein